MLRIPYNPNRQVKIWPQTDLDANLNLMANMGMSVNVMEWDIIDGNIDNDEIKLFITAEEYEKID